MRSYDKKLYLLLIVFLFTGCAVTSPSVNYYTLSPLASVEPVRSEDKPVSIAIGPLDLPNYLQRNQIVTRKNHRLKIDEYHRWGASFESSILNTLGENVRQLVNSSHIVIYPSLPRFNIDYRLVFDVVQFEGVLGEEAVLNVRWLVLDGKGKHALSVEHSKLTQTLEGKSYDALVEAYSALLSQLSQEMAKAIVELESQASANRAT